MTGQLLIFSFQSEKRVFKSVSQIDYSKLKYSDYQIENEKDPIFNMGDQVLFPPECQALFDFIFNHSDGSIWIFQTFIGYFHSCNIEVLKTLIENQKWNPAQVKFVLLFTSFSGVDFQNTEIRIEKSKSVNRQEIYESLINAGVSFYDGYWSINSLTTFEFTYVDLPFVKIF